MFRWALVKTLVLGSQQQWLLCIPLVCGLDNCGSSGYSWLLLLLVDFESGAGIAPTSEFHASSMSSLSAWGNLQNIQSRQKS